MSIKDILLDLRERIEIDRNELEIELEKQTALHLEVGELRVEAKNVVRQLENDLKFLRSDLDERIRKNPESFGIEKITVNAVDSAISRDTEYRDLENRLLEAQTDSDHFQILLSAVEERKSILKDLTSLYIYNYYMSNPGNEKEAVKNLATDRLKNWKEDKYGEGDE